MGQEMRQTSPQTIFRREHNRQNPYAQISKEFLNDSRLSWKARGLHAYLLSKPNDWKIIFAQLMKEAPDGKTSLQSAIAQLQKFGYLEKRVIRDRLGRIVRWENIIHEFPDSVPCTQNSELENQDLGKVDPDPDFPDVENQDVENQDVASQDVAGQDVAIRALLNNILSNSSTQTEKITQTKHATNSRRPRRHGSVEASKNDKATDCNSTNTPLMPVITISELAAQLMARLEAIVGVPLSSLRKSMPEWVMLFGVDYLVKKAIWVKENPPRGGWKNPIGVLTKAINDNWPETLNLGREEGKVALTSTSRNRYPAFFK